MYRQSQTPARVEEATAAQVTQHEGTDVNDEPLDVFIAQWIRRVECECLTRVEPGVDAIEHHGVEVDVEPQGRVEELGADHRPGATAGHAAIT